MHKAALFITLLAAGFAACGGSILDSYPFPEGMVFFTHPPLALEGAQGFISMGEPNVRPKTTAVSG